MTPARLALIALTLLAPVARAQISTLADLNAEQIRGLDRATTAIVIPGGILEEHGPFLPVYTDGYADQFYARHLATTIAARPGWRAVVFPEIPLGFGGANNIGAKWDFPGSFTVRLATLRAVYMDLADALGAQHFRWIFIVHDHGDPAHNQALDQASDYFHDTYGGTMLHLFGLTEVNACYDLVTAKDEDGFSVHAGSEEHSEMLFLHPDLVMPGHQTARPVTGKNFVDLYNLAERDDWPGYFGSPKLASATLGRRVMTACAHHLDQVALRVLDGLDYRTLARFYDHLDPRDSIGDAAEREHDRAGEAAQRRWLTAHGWN